MSKLVVVALPREDDYVHKISSEKEPHCTILFLGEGAGKPVNDIASFVAHAVSFAELEPFGLSVDYRGVLGEDEADVVFFKEDYCCRRLAEFRSHLLKDPQIRDAYDSVDQFDGWTPHLTLGYPETPAHKDQRDHPGIHWVEFDRIALWTEDSEGYEFRLDYNYNDLMEVSMSALSHYGVKGMRWGVRKDHSTDVRTTAVINKGLSRKTKVKAKGGRGQEATEDAIKAAAQKQKLKKSGVAALSNAELRELGTRLQLEQQVSQLASPKGKKFVQRKLGQAGERQVDRGIQEGIKKGFEQKKK
jgi:2'-5' RNA ligase